MPTLPTTPRGPDLAPVFRATVLRATAGDAVEAMIDLRFGHYVRLAARLFGVTAGPARAGLEDLLRRTAFKDRDHPYHVVKSHPVGPGRWELEVQGHDGTRPVSVNRELVRLGLAASTLPDD